MGELAHAPALATVDVIIIVGFLVIVSLIGYMMSRVANKGMDDYFLGGNRIPWWVLGASTATSNFDMSGTMIIVAVVFALGMKGFFVEFRGGVGLSLPFLMVFLGKWLRRSRVMTSAEWMKLRFGTDTQGKWAHILSATANVLLSLGMIVYFAKGAGKFLTFFLPYPEVACTAAMVGIGLFYTLMSGLYGVVFTDIVQMILLVFTAIYVTVHAFAMAPDVEMPAAMMSLALEIPEGMGESLLARDASYWEPIFNMFGLCVVMWFFRSMLEGMGGVGGYTDQRFFAARNEREASLLTLEAIVLSLFRWTMVAGLVVMGYSILAEGGAGADMIRSDSEQVLPVVLGQMLPVGIKGLVLAGLIAAAMSTFDSTLNAGASYVVKDIYQSYIRPDADGKQLMSVSRWATVGLCVAGVLLAAIVPNINKIWGLITMGLGAGLFVPLFLRWYWPRFNGYGFAAGTGTGIVAALVIKAFLPWNVDWKPVVDLPLYYSFPLILGCALVGSVVVSLLTAPTDDKILTRFWVQINPWGPWGRYAELAQEEGLVEETTFLKRILEKLNDAIALVLAVPLQISLLLMGMAFVWHDWEHFGLFITIAVFASIGLYFFWYRNLKSEKDCLEEDEKYKEMASVEDSDKDEEAAESA